MLRSVILATLLASSLASAQARHGDVAASATPAGFRTPTAAQPVSLSASAPSWVSATLAAWMLDEATGVRVNAQGNAAKDFAANASVPNDTTLKVEGAASMHYTSGSGNSSTVGASAWDTLASPVTLGCWIRIGTGNTEWTDALWRTPVDGFELQHQLSTHTYYFGVKTAGTNVNTTAVINAVDAWTHVVGTNGGGTSNLYFNGAVAATNASVPGFTPTASYPVYIGFPNPGTNAYFDECFIAGAVFPAASICRICSCGLRGEQCTCDKTAYVSKGRNVASCGSCALPADCSAPLP